MTVPPPKIDLCTVVAPSYGSARLMVTSYLISGVAHLAGGLLLGSGLMRLLPPPSGPSSIESTASPAVIAVAAVAAPTEAAAAVPPAVRMSIDAPRAASDAVGHTARSPLGRLTPLDAGAAAETTVAAATPDVDPQPAPPELPARVARHELPEELPEEDSLSPKPPRLPRSDAPARPDTPTEAAPPSLAARHRAGQDADTPPQKAYSPPPRYPADAWQQGIGGRVVLRVKLAASGRVVEASVYRSSGHRSLDRAALEAVRRWQFEPARRLGVAVATEVAVPITFVYEPDGTR